MRKMYFFLPMKLIGLRKKKKISFGAVLTLTLSPTLLSQKVD
jgi:hypothetical protein